MNHLLTLCLKAGLANIANQRTAIRRENRRADLRDVEEFRRQSILASQEDFFLRAKSNGYDLGEDPDPDGVWPSKYPK